MISNSATNQFVSNRSHIAALASRLNDGEAYCCESNGMKLLVTNVALYRLGKTLGKGESSRVVSAKRFPLDGSASTRKVIKISKDSFAKQAKHLKRIGRSETIDFFHGVYTNGKYHFAICDRSEGNLKSLVFTAFYKPVSFIVGKLIHCATGIALIHESGRVHRDIKGENLLINRNKSGRVSDFGLVKKIKSEKYFTLTTPIVAAPFIWDSLRDQYDANFEDEGREGLGCHTKGADLFAFGRTLYEDVVVPLIDQFGKEIDGIDLLRSKTFSKKFSTDEEVLGEIARLAKKYPGRISMCLEQENRAVEYCRFPSREKAYQGALCAIDRLEDVLDESEREKLKQLAELAWGLQSPTREELCEFLGVRTTRENEGDLLMAIVKERLEAIQEPVQLKRRKTASR